MVDVVSIWVKYKDSKGDEYLAPVSIAEAKAAIAQLEGAQQPLFDVVTA